jgi:hypothetical protein
MKQKDDKVNPAKELAKKKAAKRTDAAGRSGMGESGKSNMMFKGGSSVSSANKTAQAASTKGGRVVDEGKYITSIKGAADYAYKK